MKIQTKTPPTTLTEKQWEIPKKGTLNNPAWVAILKILE
jgi:hypothetical protein